MTAVEAKKLIMESVKAWEPFPDMEFGEVRGPLSEEEEYFIFEIDEHDKITGRTEPDLLEVNKKTGEILRVVEEYD